MHESIVKKEKINESFFRFYSDKKILYNFLNWFNLAYDAKYLSYHNMGPTAILIILLVHQAYCCQYF